MLLTKNRNFSSKVFFITFKKKIFLYLWKEVWLVFSLRYSVFGRTGGRLLHLQEWATGGVPGGPDRDHAVASHGFQVSKIIRLIHDICTDQKHVD